MNDADLEHALSAFFLRVATPEPSERLRQLIAADRAEAGTARRSLDQRMRRLVAGLLAAAAIGTAAVLLGGIPRVDRTVQPSSSSLPGVASNGQASLTPTSPACVPNLGASPPHTPRASSPRSISTEIWGQTATLLPDCRILLAGGQAYRIPTHFPVLLAPASSATLYDPSTGQFSPTGSMTAARYMHTATLLLNGQVLITGGGQADAQRSAELYDPRTGTFRVTGSMTTARIGQTATLLADGRVLIVGGGFGRAPLASAELYDPATGTFSPTGSMATPRFGHTATRLLDGRVLIAGGYSGTGPVAAAELYDPKTGTFSPTGAMLTARFTPTATLLTDGMVLLTGGDDSHSVVYSSAELYDPATGAFEATGSMTEARSYHSAALLADGSVLVVGPYGQDAPSSATAEVYEPSSRTFSQTRWATIPWQYDSTTATSNGFVLVGQSLIEITNP